MTSELFGLLRSVNKSLQLTVFEKRTDDIPAMSSQILLNLNNDELNLDNGRFKNFTRLKRYSYKTITPIIFWKNSMLFFADFDRITERVNWIAETIRDSWSIQVIPYVDNNNLCMDCAFSFKNKTEGGHFALRWR